MYPHGTVRLDSNEEQNQKGGKREAAFEAEGKKDDPNRGIVLVSAGNDNKPFRLRSTPVPAHRKSSRCAEGNIDRISYGLETAIKDALLCATSRDEPIAALKHHRVTQFEEVHPPFEPPYSMV
jgi:hypothetical protein